MFDWQNHWKKKCTYSIWDITIINCTYKYLFIYLLCIYYTNEIFFKLRFVRNTNPIHFTKSSRSLVFYFLKIVFFLLFIAIGIYDVNLRLFLNIIIDMHMSQIYHRHFFVHFFFTNQQNVYSLNFALNLWWCTGKITQICHNFLINADRGFLNRRLMHPGIFIF